KKWGIRFQKFEKQGGRTNLVWSLGNPRLPEILVAAHSDIVPAGEGWRTDPFRLARTSRLRSRQENFLTGRGVVDNKSPLAGMLLATKILKKIENKLKNKIVFAAVADEERGNKFGMDFLLAKKIFRPVAAVIPDSCGNNREIEIAEKGVVHLRVRAFGKQGHGSIPEKSKNAIFILEDFLRNVRKLKFKKREKLLTPATISVGAFHAGEAANVIPGEAEALLDIRYPSNESKTKILQKLTTLAKAEVRKWKVRNFEFEILTELPSSETFEKSPIVQSTLRAVQKVTHRKPKIIGMPAFTFGGVLRSRGIPTVGFGPGDLEECHRSNEKIRESEVYEFTEILVELLRNLQLK
ncbi:M20/M25/M40 family metallo-hydrolase, partial [Patescibacteria group bacterium]|nr:M20/M25/M40 family metallo-hydrolase [Patescibacteria group bacterium]